MKRAFILMVAACFLFVLQAGAQEQTTTNKRDNDRPDVAPSRGQVYVRPVIVQSQETKAIEPVRKVTTPSNSPQSTYTGATAPVNSSAKTVSENVRTDEKSKTSDFPVYINTGNPEKDAATFQQAKKEWIAKNPEKYQEMLNSSK